MTKQKLSLMGYAEILADNRLLGEQLSGNQFVVRILSNIIVTPIKELLEYELRRNNINATVVLGEYDNICQNSFELSDTNVVLIFWDVTNISESFPSWALTMDDSILQQIEEKILEEMNLVLHNLRNVPVVLFNAYTSILFNAAEVSENALDRIVKALNNHLRNSQYNNLRVIDIDKCIALVSVERSVDWRMWHTSKMLYSIEFFTAYVQHVAPIFRSLNGMAKKVLIFDCDNTLWKGIIGEDGLDGIEISKNSKNGRPFSEVQTLALALYRKGVILGLCSKNEQVDVDEVLEKHPEMILRNEHFIVKRVNWDSKVDNLQQIAKELNLGLDSFVFIDDSEFEASLVEQMLPQVAVLRVPKSLNNYPQYFREHMNLFWAGTHTSEDVMRTLMYKQQAVREREEAKFASLEEYLRSLKLVLTVFCDSPKTVTRVAQLTQKTNQFNLTTKRYSEVDINSFVTSQNWFVYAFSMADHFGDFGLTGVALIKLNSSGSEAEIDTFLLSCRVLGRNAEIKFFDFIIGQLQQYGVKIIKGRYIPTNKNSQVITFYEARGFNVVENNAEGKTYQLEVNGYRGSSIEYIKLNLDNEYGRAPA